MQEKHLSGTPIYYWISGNNTTESILFLHSAFSNHHCFDEQIDFFITDYQVITMDLLGHGKSIPDQKEDAIEKTTEYIQQILAAHRISKIHLVGVSMGCILAQDFANHYPEQVSSLCCIGGYDINNFDRKMQKENNTGQAKLILKAIFSIKWFAHENRKISAFTEKAQEVYFQMNTEFKKSSFRYLAGLSKLVNQQAPMPRDYPLLIGCGNHDAPLALKASRIWNESEPNSVLIIFEKAGHHVNMDIPDIFNIELKNFLSGVKAKT